MTSRGPLHTEHIVISFHIIANLSCNRSENDNNAHTKMESIPSNEEPVLMFLNKKRGKLRF